MDMICFLNVKPEDHDNFRMALERIDINVTEKKPMTEAERAKKYRDNKKQRHEIVTNCDDAEEKEKGKEEGALPLSPLSSLSSSPLIPPNNNPITPYNPSLPEEEKGKEKGVLAMPRQGDLKTFGSFVRLTEKEFLTLQKKFGYGKTMSMIENMNNYIGEDPKRQRIYQTRNHYLTLLNWERRDKKQEKPKEKTFADIARELEQTEPRWDIEL